MVGMTSACCGLVRGRFRPDAGQLAATMVVPVGISAESKHTAHCSGAYHTLTPMGPLSSHVAGTLLLMQYTATDTQWPYALCSIYNLLAEQYVGTRCMTKSYCCIILTTTGSVRSVLG